MTHSIPFRIPLINYWLYIIETSLNRECTEPLRLCAITMHRTGDSMKIGLDKRFAIRPFEPSEMKRRQLINSHWIKSIQYFPMTSLEMQIRRKIVLPCGKYTSGSRKCLAHKVTHWIMPFLGQKYETRNGEDTCDLCGPIYTLVRSVETHYFTPFPMCVSFKTDPFE